MKLEREDLDHFLWLQRAVEHVLKEETERRARAAGRVPEGSDLWRVEVGANFYAPSTIVVTYEVAAPLGPRSYGSRDYTTYEEAYSLAEALALCLTPPTNPPASK